MLERPKIDKAIFLGSQAAFKTERCYVENLVIVRGVTIDDPQLKSGCINSLQNLPNLGHILFLVCYVDDAITCISILE